MSKAIDGAVRLAICAIMLATVSVHCGQTVATESNSESAPSPTATNTESDPGRRFQVESLRGQVVWYAEALHEQLGIQTVPEAKQRVLALATQDGKLFPIIENLRGRAFRTDPRLREMEVELLVRRYEATPSIQILRVYQWKDGQKYQVDYWCDVCAIVMFEDGPCSCCQQHNRLRTRPVEQ